MSNPMKLDEIIFQIRMDAQEATANGAKAEIVVLIGNIPGMAVYSTMGPIMTKAVIKSFYGLEETDGHT